MDVREAPESDSPYTNALVAGYAWNGLTLTFSFPTSAAQFTGYSSGEPFANFASLNAVQQAAARAALASISSFTDLVFTEVTGADAASAVLRFGMTDDTPTAHAYLPSPAEQGGDSWYRNTGGSYSDPKMGNYAWLTFLHEIGHALGFTHPHEATPPMDLYRDWMPFTVMSYRSRMGGPIETGYTNEEWGFAQSYMMEDIAGLQFLYGADFGYNASSNVYQWNPLTGEMSIDGVGQGAPGGNRVFLTVWDGGGNDTYDFSNYPANPSAPLTLTIDLRPGQWTTLPPEQRAFVAPSDAVGNIANALLYRGDPRSMIENAIGSAGADLINGNDSANHIDGGLGNDEVYGFGGDDTLLGERVHGGDGDDIIHGQSNGVQGDITGGPHSNFLEGDAGNDRIYGGPLGDTLWGGAGDDWLDGGDFGDILIGHEGNDVLLGGAGNDTMNGLEGNDRLEGGIGDDILFGFAGDDELIGGDGNDTFAAGAGADVQTGGLGDDRYELLDAGDQAIELPGQGIDTVMVNFSYTAPEGIENIVMDLGPAPGATITGNAANNLMTGGYQNDVLIGGAGVDDMRGLYGDDTYYVDDAGDLVIEEDRELAGFDTVYSSVSYALREYADDSSLDIDPRTRGRASWSNQIELLILTGLGNLSGTGNSLANRIEGNAGNNQLDGKAGDDTLLGGSGSDLLAGGAGNDALDGGQGFDRAVFLGDRSAYTITIAGAVTHVTGPDGSDTLTGIERLQFADTTYELLAPTSFLSPFLGAFGLSPEGGGWSDQNAYPRLAADIDGNGHDDLVGFGSAGVYAALTSAMGTAGAPYLAVGGFGTGPEGGGWSDMHTYPRLFADINGDGLADLVGFGNAGVYAALGTGGGFGETFLAAAGFGAGAEGGGWSDNQTYPRLFADINGDGLADLVGFGSAGVHAALGLGDGRFGAAYVAASGFGAGAEGGGWSDTDTYPRMLADVNGDGLDDLVGFGSSGVHVALAAGGGSFGAAFLAASGFGAGVEGSNWTDNDLYKRTLADINGDGRDDIVGFGAPGTFAALAQADGTFAPAYLAFGGFGTEDGWTSDDLYHRVLGDLNGDGNLDLVGFGDGGAYVAHGDGHGGFAQAELAIATFGGSQEAGGWTSQASAPRIFADINGDGADDIVGFGGAGVYVALSGVDWPLA